MLREPNPRFVRSGNTTLGGSKNNGMTIKNPGSSHHSHKLGHHGLEDSAFPFKLLTD
jgi:hypothetical protein